MIGKTIRNFRIISEIGKGGMGVVYLAEHVELPKRFAIKSPSTALSGDPHFRERFYREAQNQALLAHPNIVQVTDFFEENGQFFLVMEYVDGQDLGKAIDAKGQLPEGEALSIVVDLLRGLEFAHSRGVIHRDIKPSNVLIDKSGIAHIMDFGIALLVGAQRLTTTGAAGSPYYMSPEQITRPQEIDQRSDIYSLGVVLYETLTGEVPFEGDTEFAIKDQHVRSPAPDPRRKNPAISPELAQIVLKAMAKDPNERFQSCTEFLQRIRDYERTRLPSDQQGKKRLGLRLALVAILGILLGLLFVPRTPPPPPPLDNGDPKIALNLIQSGSEKALIICQEFARVQQKEEALKQIQLVQNHVNSTTLESLKERIEEHKKNIEEGVSSYGDFLRQLGGLKDDVVGKEFEEYARMLEKKQSYNQIQTTRLMKSHYQQYRDRQKSIDITLMREACIRELGGGS